MMGLDFPIFFYFLSLDMGLAPQWHLRQLNVIIKRTIENMLLSYN